MGKTIVCFKLHEQMTSTVESVIWIILSVTATPLMTFRQLDLSKQKTIRQKWRDINTYVSEQQGERDAWGWKMHSRWRERGRKEIKGNKPHLMDLSSVGDCLQQSHVLIPELETKPYCWTVSRRCRTASPHLLSSFREESETLCSFWMPCLINNV